MKVLQNILVPPLIHSAPVPGIENCRSLNFFVVDNTEIAKISLNAKIVGPLIFVYVLEGEGCREHQRYITWEVS